MKSKKRRIFLQTMMSFLGFLMILSQFGSHSSGQGGKMNLRESEDSLSIILEYYSNQGVMTDPGKYAYLYEGLPSDVPQLVEVVQGVMIHIFHAHRYGIELSEERKKEVQIRKVNDMLKRIKELDEHSITFEREPDKRLVGNCRDFSIFICSLLRYKSIPARARCGFGTYFTPGKYEDHWICEYWNSDQRRWVRIDTQVDSLQKQAFDLEFNVHDLPAGKFLSAGEVWKLCRTGEIDPDLCGIFDMKGLWFVRGNVVRDLMALNKLEVLPWDCNELMDGPEKQLSQEEFDLLDKVAELTTAGNISFPEVRSLYESNSALRMPADWKP